MRVCLYVWVLNKQTSVFRGQRAVVFSEHDADRHAFYFIGGVGTFHVGACLVESAMFAGYLFVVASGSFNDYPLFR